MKSMEETKQKHPKGNSGFWEGTISSLILKA